MTPYKVFSCRKYQDQDNSPATNFEVSLWDINVTDEWINNALQENILIIDESMNNIFEYDDNQQDEDGDEDTEDYAGIFIIFLPWVTKLAALNPTTLLFVDIDLTFSISDTPPANSYYTNMSLHILITLIAIQYRSGRKIKNLLILETKEQSFLIQMTKM